MKVLIVSQYFWPENFRVNDLAKGLKDRGHDVVVFTAKPNYPEGVFYSGYSFWGNSFEIWENIRIYRAPVFQRRKSKIGLAFNYISFVIFGSFKAFYKKIPADAILFYQLSPVTSILPAYILKIKTKAKLITYVQDMWPESLEAIIGLRNPVLKKIVRVSSDFCYKLSDELLCQSRFIQNEMKCRRLGINRIGYLPNTTESFYHPQNSPPEHIKKYFTGSFNLVFAGNIGHAQSFETLIAAAAIVKAKNKSVHWIILGDGSEKQKCLELSQRMGVNDVFHFIGSFPPASMPDFFSAADALLISLRRMPIYGITIPSKLQSYMASGKPVIGSLYGEGASIIEQSGCGVIAAPDDAGQLAEKILEFISLDLSVKLIMGQKGREYFLKEFGRESVLDSLETCLYE